MKHTKAENMDIGRRMYNKEITYKDAMQQYGISESNAHKCMSDYKIANGIPLKPHPISANISNQSLDDIERYMSMTKEELIKELILSKVNEARAKKGYEVKGVGANKEFISLNNKNLR